MASPNDDQPAKTGKKLSLLTPLGIISLFASIAEASFAVAITKAPESIQHQLITYFVLLPFFLIAVFFAVLWFKPWHFYAPADYAGTDMKSFIDALRGVTVAIEDSTKKREEERQERLKALQEQQLRMSNRNEFQRLTLEINKLIINDPEIDAFFDNEDRKTPEATKHESLAYIYLNMYELVYEYYHSQTTLPAEKSEMTLWDEMMRQTIRDSSIFKKLLLKHDTKLIYHKEFYEYITAFAANDKKQ